MTQLDFESDQFLQLLTDALRAGPGSPEWHEAVAALSIDGLNHANEYQLLLSAREHLESGRDYRSIRAGPTFTRRLNDALDGAATRPPPPTTNAIAIISAGVMLAAAAVLAYLLFPSGAPSAAIEKLSNTYFVDALVNASFESPTDGFSLTGALQIEMQHGLRPVLTSNAGSVGGVIWSQELDASQPIAIEATLKVLRPSDDLIAEVFVADDAGAGNGRGTSAHEFVWRFQSGQAKVVIPSGRVERQTQPNRAFRGTIVVRLIMDRDAAIVEQFGKPIWSGAHGLSSTHPRSIGLRFLRSGSDKNPDPPLAFGSFKLIKP